MKARETATLTAFIETGAQSKQGQALPRMVQTYALDFPALFLPSGASCTVYTPFCPLPIC